MKHREIQVFSEWWCPLSRGLGVAYALEVMTCIFQNWIFFAINVEERIKKKSFGQYSIHTKTHPQFSRLKIIQSITLCQNKIGNQRPFSAILCLENSKTILWQETTSELAGWHKFLLIHTHMWMQVALGPKKQMVQEHSVTWMNVPTCRTLKWAQKNNLVSRAVFITVITYTAVWLLEIASTS